jgi:hypothetical protein
VLVVDSIPLGSAGKPDKGRIREALKLTEPGAQ